MSRIRVAVLTVSDTASQDDTADKSGPTITSILSKHGYDCRHAVIVPDEEDLIRDTVKTWCQEGNIDLIVTTGGTGFGVHDKTPEAISPILDREAPGLVHLLLSSSLRRTPFAALSRPIAGTIKRTLIVTLPGSVKAVTENLHALLADGLIDHAVELIKGGSGQHVHAQLSLSSSDSTPPKSGSEDHLHPHHHHYHHGHSTPQPRTAVSQDPSANVSGRQRISPFPMVSVRDALTHVVQEIEPLPPQELPVNSQLRGCILAEDVHAPFDVPCTLTSNVDGYALRSSSPAGIYDVITGSCESLPEGNVIYRINTGGVLPIGADAVIMVEDTRIHSTAVDLSGNVDEKQIETLAQVSPGENVRQPGSDVKQGDLVLEKGHMINSVGGEVGTLAFIGRTKVKVYPKPVVALLSTGNELKDLHAPEGQGGGVTFDTNRPSLQAVLEGMGYQVIDLGIVPDELNAHVLALKKGLELADILITTGGTSMGTSDLLKPAIEHELNGTIYFGRVSVKPGKPTTFGMIATAGGRNERTPIFALPGNPASALVTFHIFVVPALRKLGGSSSDMCHLPRVWVKLQDSMYLDPRPEYHRVTIRAEHDGLKAYSTGGQRSSRVTSLSGANGLVVLPGRKEGGPDRIHSGDIAEAVIIGEIQMKY